MALCVTIARAGRLTPERPNEFPSFSSDEANQFWEIVMDSCAQIPSERPVSAAVRNRIQAIRRLETEDPLHFLDDDTLIMPALNSNGTPRRPMNPFMIFARRRRFEIEVNSPSLRMGDISSMLSSEWSAMTADAKKLYLDHARKLKDGF
ncbi:hypothetical protein FRC07_009399, partial [Ceratobasidium sp. 392]